MSASFSFLYFVAQMPIFFCTTYHTSSRTVRIWASKWNYSSNQIIARVNIKADEVRFVKRSSDELKFGGLIQLSESGNAFNTFFDTKFLLMVRRLIKISYIKPKYWLWHWCGRQSTGLPIQGFDVQNNHVVLQLIQPLILCSR